LLSKYQSLGVIKNAPRRSRKELDQIINEVESMFAKDVDKADIVQLLNKLLPGFKHIETGLNLDQKM